MALIIPRCRLLCVGYLFLAPSVANVLGNPQLASALMHKTVQSYLRVFAKNMGIKGRVILEELRVDMFPDGSMISSLQKQNGKEKLFYYSSAQAVRFAKKLPHVHRIFLTADERDEWHTIAIMHHELGHARYYEKNPDKNPNFIAAPKRLAEIVLSKILPPSANDPFFKANYTNRYTAELIADAAVPDNKKLLLALRNEFAKHARFDLLSITGVLSDINFSQPMNESFAQQADLLNYENGSCYPSGYRRAYNINARLQTLDSVKNEKRLSSDNALFEELAEKLREARYCNRHIVQA